MLRRLFGFDQGKTTVKTEIWAGITSFLTMSYILAVNPAMFSLLDGMPQGSVFTTTAIVAIVSTLIVAFLAKMPFGIAPGMGGNALFVFTICMSMGYSWQFALTGVLIEGLILLFLTVTNLREAIISSIPKSIQQAISIGIGLFITFIGLQNAGIVVDDPSTLVRFGNVSEGHGLLAIIGLILTAAMMILKIKGAILIGIALTAIIGIPMGITQFQGFVSMPQSIAPIFCKFDFSNILSADMLLIVLSLLFLDLFSLTGSAIGVCLKAGYGEAGGKIRGIKKLFIADSIGTIVSSISGSTAACTFIESSSGVEEGGRSGLTAFVTAICFVAALFFSPLFLSIPTAAISPALIIVGLSMFSGIKDISFEDMSEYLPAFMTIVIMPMAYSIADGIIFGILSYVFINLLCGKGKKISTGTYILAGIFLLKYIFL